jgi:hypothetical protein
VTERESWVIKIGRGTLHYTTHTRTDAAVDDGEGCRQQNHNDQGHLEPVCACVCICMCVYINIYIMFIYLCVFTYTLVSV